MNCTIVVFQFQRVECCGVFDLAVNSVEYHLSVCIGCIGQIDRILWRWQYIEATGLTRCDSFQVGAVC